MSIGKRLEKVRDELGLTQKAISTLVGCHPKSWEGYEKDANIPGGEILSKLSTHGVDINWLLTGMGEGSISGTTSMDIYSVELSAGFGSLANQENIIDRYTLPDNFYKSYGLNRTNSAGVFIKGDSMEPKFYSGDIAIVDLSTSKFETDGIYAFCYDDHCFIKHLQLIGNKLYAVSSNKFYDRWLIDSDENFKIIGMVKAIIGKV